MSAYIICYCCLTTPFFIRKSMALLAFVSLKGVRPNRPNHPRLYGRKKLKIQTRGVYKLNKDAASSACQRLEMEVLNALQNIDLQFLYSTNF